MHPVIPILYSVGAVGAIMLNVISAKLKKDIASTPGGEHSAKAKMVTVLTRFCNFTLAHGLLSSVVGGSASFAAVAVASDNGHKLVDGDWKFIAKAVVFTASAAVIPMILAASASAGLGVVGGAIVGLAATYVYNLARFKMFNPDASIAKICCDAAFSTFCTTTVLGFFIPAINVIPVPIKATIDAAVLHFIKPILIDDLLCKRVVTPLADAVARTYATLPDCPAPIVEIGQAIDGFFTKIASLLKDQIPDFSVRLP